MAKPALFIGCSAERLPIAKAIKELLTEWVEATVWDEAEDEFSLGVSILDGLMKAIEKFDFALFIFGNDDKLVIRGKRVSSVRENVIFELGLFLGRMGRGRAFWLSPNGANTPYQISDLEGILHLQIDDLSTDALVLQAVVDKIRKQVTLLGPRTDHAVEELSTRQVLCIASSQYSQARFKADLDYIHSFLSPEEVTSAQGINADQFYDYFSPGQHWDIVHLGVFVDKENQNMLFDGQPGSDYSNKLSIQAVESMMKDCGAHLITIITCDSLSFGARLARFTNVIAGYQAIGATAAISWSKIFYQQLAFGLPVSKSFAKAQDIADPGLILLCHNDFKFRASSRSSRISSDNATPPPNPTGR